MQAVEVDRRNFARDLPDGLLLGGQCWRPGGAWEWSGGQTWQWAPWDGEPPRFGALVLAPDGRWRAVSFDEPHPYVIESSPGG